MVASDCAETDLKILADQLSQKIVLGDRIILEGPMGAGKTTFARFLLEALKISQPMEGSPTFSIVHEYPSPQGLIIHIDYERLRSEADLESAGISSYYWEQSCIIISEWLSLFPKFQEDLFIQAQSSQQSLWYLEFEWVDDFKRNLSLFQGVKIL